MNLEPSKPETHAPPTPPPALALRTLRLYVAGASPNSARAEQNLRSALAQVAGLGDRLVVDVIDVLADARRALKDGVIVTPTLISAHGGERSVIMGDLSDAAQLHGLLARLDLAAR